ncbi:IS3 family transposase [Olsenella sp. Marseille-P4559]|uniref:IS3 family transposase n=1 Tax=Olsenella sp. Marseille-P4559 TaxID=2364795 RepID=UPI0013EEEE1D|nr:IS3 family transposase [Olsenella sp. Marseille-P4559]
MTPALAQSRGTFGSERVWARIRELGAVVSEKVVRKVMRECGLVAKTSAKGRHHGPCEGEEGRACAPDPPLPGKAEDAHGFCCPVPGKVFSTDISGLGLPSGPKACLSPMTGPLDGKVVSEAIGPSPDRGLAAGMPAGASPPFVGTVAAHVFRQ